MSEPSDSIVTFASMRSALNAALLLCVCSVCWLFSCVGAVAQDAAIEKKASWQSPTAEQFQVRLQEWFDVSAVKSLDRDKVSKRLEAQLTKSIELETSTASVESIDAIIDGFSLVRFDIAKLRLDLEQQVFEDGAKVSSLLDNPSEPALIRDHLRLYYGRWLARNKFYDESLEQLSQLKVGTVLDPASLLFYRGLMEHQLLKKADCVKTFEQLLENESILPRRFIVLSKLMLSDIKPLESDSLDEISRMMGDVGRRTGLYRSGTRVREKEEEVIKKLDKIIEEMEQQQQQMSMSQGQGGGAPSKPMDDSQRAAGKATGEVQSKSQLDGGQWGSLPPAQRAAALAEMAKDMPPHYRSVIEEYFRQLAQENEKR